MNKSLKVPFDLWDKAVEIARKHTGIEKLTHTQVIQALLSIINKKRGVN